MDTDTDTDTDMDLDLDLDLRVVDEAGASVWSASAAAMSEFAGTDPACLGAVSIGRKLQDPMNVMVRQNTVRRYGQNTVRMRDAAGPLP